jgi:3-methyladenine DNA glycosylase/8-oxoguanine DNA glycosylase
MEGNMNGTTLPPQGRDIEIGLVPLDLHATMALQHLGRFDPTGSAGPDWFGKVHLDAEGRPLTWRFLRTDAGMRVQVSGDADAARAALPAFAAQFPLTDGATDFRPDHPVLRRLAKAFRGLRLLRVPWTFDVAAGAVLQQRVRWSVACSDFRRIAERWGTRTAAGVAFPTARQLAAVPVHALEAIRIDAKRARALAGLARADSFHGFLRPDTAPHELRQRLARITGIGPWTVNMIAGFAHGDADAVPVGDLHIPSQVTSALAGEPEGTDVRMLELLEPFRGQRFRVVRLLTWASRRAPHMLRANSHPAAAPPAGRVT